MSGRTYLKKRILLRGESDGGFFKREFTIKRKVSEGASCICYEAEHRNSGRGILKEFYPRDAYSLERDGRGQLINSPEFGDANERFLEAEMEYVEPLEMLLDVRKSGENKDLDTFIPAFEIYHGCDDAGNIVGTTYIWTPEPKLETFDKICDDIHKHPGVRPEYKLVTVLTAVNSLTKCICSLHKAGLVHRDIKPSNFGFKKFGGELLTQTLSMFDVDSICSVYDKRDVMGTRGYMEPEAAFGDITNQTDIYAIGATLFHAIIVTDETRNGCFLYQEDYYDSLQEMVAESELIRASEANSHPRLRSILVKILRRCLCGRGERYGNCEELLDDLESAIFYALPSEISKTHQRGGRWILTDAEKSLDANKEKNSFLAIQYHLFENPLYQYCPTKDRAINVFLFGFGSYGQKFLDACLQDGQIRNKKLNVTVITDEETDKDLYLSERPELADFFNIGKSLKNSEDTYGNVSFKFAKLEPDNREKVIQGILMDQYDAGWPHYIFISLGDDALNYAAAKACKDVVELLKELVDETGNCSINYVCETENRSGRKDCGIVPLYINGDIKKSRLYPEIERMAFNTHLIWEKNLDIDYKATREDYMKTYNHDACVSNVLSLKYKLDSVGIDLGSCTDEDMRRAASEFGEKVANARIRNELIWTEHRRWVVEKLCLGWTRLRDLDECAYGMTKDEKHKRHICIVKSRPDQMLAEGYDCSRWDNMSNNQLEKLDELDRLSVRLHRMYKKVAGSRKKDNPLSGDIIAGIREKIEGNREATAAFQEWYASLKNIWTGDSEKLRLYKGLKNNFLAAAGNLPGEKGQSVREQVKIFEREFYPIMASMEYRDWKQGDVALVDNIPFVLTYTKKACLVIPFLTGDNSRVFGNVAAPMVVNPEKIIYLYHVREDKDERDLKKTLPYVIEFMDKKHIRAAVEFIIIYAASMSARLNKDLEGELRRVGNGRVRQVKRIVLDGDETIYDALCPYLKKRSLGKRFFAIEKNNMGISENLDGAGFYREFPHYSFDPYRMKFVDVHDCDMLNYIRKSPYITVADMFALRGAVGDNKCNQPEFFEDYGSLWKMYRQNSSVWKRLCSILGDYSDKHDILASFKNVSRKDREANGQTYNYIIPFACKRSVENIISVLKTHEIVSKESRVSAFATDSCKVKIVDLCNCRSEYDKLLSKVYALMCSDAVEAYYDHKSSKVLVKFDNLEVVGVDISADNGGRTGELKDLLNFFKEKGYIMNLSKDKRSFTYATRQIKELMTTAGKMLEVYVYHKAKELGKFDDVESGYEVEWGGRKDRDEYPLKNEMDCILTKGFRSLVVECKARTNLEQEFYQQVGTLAGKFGINTKAVLIADTQEKDFYDNVANNKMQRERGEEYGILTIWRPEEIDDIGNMLLAVIDGTYQAKAYMRGGSQ